MFSIEKTTICNCAKMNHFGLSRTFLWSLKVLQVEKGDPTFDMFDWLRKIWIQWLRYFISKYFWDYKAVMRHISWESQILMTTSGFELRTSYMQRIYLTPTRILDIVNLQPYSSYFHNKGLDTSFEFLKISKQLFLRALPDFRANKGT